MTSRGRVMVLCLLLTSQTSVLGGFDSSDSQCDPPGQWKAGQALDEDASVHAGATIRLLMPVKTGKMQECVSQCCQHDKCRVAAIEVQDRGKIMCTLYDCSPPEKCVFKKSEKLLSYDRTETWFLTKDVTKPPSFTSTKTRTETRATTSATTAAFETSSTVETTVPYAADTTSNSAANATTAATSNTYANLTIVAATKGTLNVKVNTTLANSTTSTTVDPVSNYTDTSTTRSSSVTKHSILLTESFPKHNWSSTIGVTYLDVSTPTAATKIVPLENNESHFNTVSTTVEFSSPSPRTPIVQLSLTTETSPSRRTSTSSTASPALQASMQGIFTPRNFDDNSWLPFLSSTSRPTTKLAEVTPKSVNRSQNVIDEKGKVTDLRGPIQIFAPTTLNVVAKASPSISLVIGLCLGLLLIFVVMGLIGRRVLDVWQRRHYSRMDFLVDGMYHVT
uniref:Putative c-type lectin family member n=1 Tax=Ixodes scapularis TaxID=6945 RepID=A0A4D5RND5_IXOSC